LAFLFSVDIPPYGGDTIWVSLPAIYDTLSPALQELVCGLRQRHGVVGGYRASIEDYLRRDGLSADQIRTRIEEAAKTQTNDHPLVRTHPRTRRRSLYLSPRFSDHIVGLSDEESRALLALLHARLDDPNFQVRWRWRPNDLAIWDEVATNHRALADHFAIEPQYRRMRRCTVAGSVPFFDPEATPRSRRELVVR
jgi:taurine dioxygenase